MAGMMVELIDSNEWKIDNLFSTTYNLQRTVIYNLENLTLALELTKLHFALQVVFHICISCTPKDWNQSKWEESVHLSEDQMPMLSK